MKKIKEGERSMNHKKFGCLYKRGKPASSLLYHSNFPTNSLFAFPWSTYSLNNPFLSLFTFFYTSLNLHFYLLQSLLQFIHCLLQDLLVSGFFFFSYKNIIFMLFYILLISCVLCGYMRFCVFEFHMLDICVCSLWVLTILWKRC